MLTYSFYAHIGSVPQLLFDQQYYAYFRSLEVKTNFYDVSTPFTRKIIVNLLAQKLFIER